MRLRALIRILWLLSSVFASVSFAFLSHSAFFVVASFMALFPAFSFLFLWSSASRHSSFPSSFAFFVALSICGFISSTFFSNAVLVAASSVVRVAVCDSAAVFFAVTSRLNVSIVPVWFCKSFSASVTVSSDCFAPTVSQREYVFQSSSVGLNVKFWGAPAAVLLLNVVKAFLK